MFLFYPLKFRVFFLLILQFFSVSQIILAEKNAPKTNLFQTTSKINSNVQMQEKNAKLDWFQVIFINEMDILVVILIFGYILSAETWKQIYNKLSHNNFFA